MISCPEETRSGERVVIRAHGIGRQVYEALKQQGAILIDATCPFVKKIHRIVEKHSAVGRVHSDFGESRTSGSAGDHGMELQSLHDHGGT